MIGPHIGMVLMLALLTTTPVFGRFSQFVSVSPYTPASQHHVQPVVQFTSTEQGLLTVAVPVIRGSRGYWLIVCKEPLSPEKQNFREMVQQPARERQDVVLIAPLTADYDRQVRQRDEDDGACIRVQMSAELAGRAYIYIDYPDMVSDGGYYYAIDIPSYLKRLKNKQKDAEPAQSAGGDGMPLLQP